MEFKNLKDLFTKLSDENAARRHMEFMRWGDAPFCPHCNSTKPYKLKDGKTYRCKDKTCKKNFTVTMGTIFENSKISLTTWIAAIFVLTAHKKGISSLQLGRDLGITQKTAWFVLHRVRYIMGDNSLEPDLLENIVETDETYVGGKFANMNRGKRKEWQEKGIDNKIGVMGMVQRNEYEIVERPHKLIPGKTVKEKVITKDGKARLTVIGANTFKEVIKENVKPEVIIMTDSHLAYQGIAAEYAGHGVVNHSEMQFRDGIAYTNTVEGFFSQLKRSIFGIYHSVSAKHLQQYCFETSYRYNNRKISDKERFNQTLQNVEGRLTYNNLIQKKKSTTP